MILISLTKSTLSLLHQSISMAAQSPYPLLFTVLVSHLTSPSHSANMLIMFVVYATWRFAAFPLFVTFSQMVPLKPFPVLLFYRVWITVMLCLLVLQNSRMLRTILLDSSSVVPNWIMSPLSFIVCSDFLSI